MTIDLAKISSSYLDMMLKGAIEKQGLRTVIYEPVVEENLYEDLYPETNYTLKDCVKILLSTAFSGGNEINFVSLYDKLDEEYLVVTNTKLEKDYKLKVEFPDGKLLNLVISDSQVIHQLSTMVFMYYSRVV